MPIQLISLLSESVNVCSMHAVFKHFHELIINHLALGNWVFIKITFKVYYVQCLECSNCIDTDIFSYLYQITMTT